MTQQQKINKFIHDLEKFLKSYYSDPILSTNIKETSDKLLLTIKGITDNDILKISTDGEEILIENKHTHWHVDNYDTPGKFERMFRQTIDTVIANLDSQINTISVYRNDKRILAGTYDGHFYYGYPIEKFLSGIKKSCKRATTIKVNRWNHKERIYKIKNLIFFRYLKEI